MNIEDDQGTYYYPPSREDEEFPITPEIQQLMDDEATKVLLAMAIAEELGLNDFGEVRNPSN